MNQLFTDQSNDSRREKVFEILQNVAAGIRSAEVPLSSLVVTKQLSKNPKDYPEKKLAHVSVALRLNKEGGRMWKAGDTVPYVICEVIEFFFASKKLNFSHLQKKKNVNLKNYFA